MGKINEFHIKKDQDVENSWLIDRLHPDKPGVYETYVSMPRHTNAKPPAYLNSRRYVVENDPMFKPMQDLVEWMKAGGSEISKIQLFNYAEGFYGVHAKEDIKAGD